MRKLLLSICCLGCALWAQAKDFTQYVNPLMGTLSSFELSTGNTYPAIARPWGMNFWTPQTGKMGDGWQYVYTLLIRFVVSSRPTSPVRGLMITVSSPLCL